MEPGPDSREQPQSRPGSLRALKQAQSESSVSTTRDTTTLRRSDSKSTSAPAAMQPGQTAPITTTTATPAKVAIPRQRANVGPRYNRRVAKACESCRQRKTKCSGDSPVCRQCRELRVRCQYPDGMRERTKRHMEQLSTKAEDYESLLKEIRNAVDEGVAERITSTLFKHSSEAETSNDNPSSSSRTPLDDAEIEEASSPSSIGSLEAIDRVEEDINREENVRATGFIGKNSEISWMQRLQREAEQRSRKLPGTYEGAPSSRHFEDFALNAANYHLDDLGVSVPGPVDMYAMPSREQADSFFEDYLETVHPYLPIINRPLFSSQYKYFFANSARPGDKWLAILNMIFAISAKHAHLIQAPWRGKDQHDHLVYLTRARFLSMNGDVLFSHPDLQQVQVEGLIAFYLLASDQINRSWRISSLAVRSAIALGINLKSSSDATPNVSKEARYRLWWSLYIFEHTLGVMTGRATCILDGICTTPYPLPFEEERFQEPEVNQMLNNPQLRQNRIQSSVASAFIRTTAMSSPVGAEESERREKRTRASWLQNIPANPSLLFLYYVDLTVISQEIINKVYTADAVIVPWTTIENRIKELKTRIDTWFEQLPASYNFTIKASESPEQLRAKLGLAFHYYSIRITLGRPCLCRRDASLSHQNSFSHKMALISLDAASRMLDLLPDPPDAIQLYRLAPWWCILHYLMQATTVLLLELSFANVHTPDDEKFTLQSAKKAIRWLYAMSEHSMASRRAWYLCDGCLRRIAIGMDFDISDLPSPSFDTTSQQTLTSTALAPSSAQLPSTGITGMNFPSTGTPDGLSAHSATNWGGGPESGSLNPQLFGELDPQVAEMTNLASMPPTTSGSYQMASDTHFPFDPISGEFIRSFFPNAEDSDW